MEGLYDGGWDGEDVGVLVGVVCGGSSIQLFWRVPSIFEEVETSLEGPWSVGVMRVGMGFKKGGFGCKAMFVRDDAGVGVQGAKLSALGTH